jgi:hypothetical protein
MRELATRPVTLLAVWLPRQLRPSTGTTVPGKPAALT